MKYILSIVFLLILYVGFSQKIVEIDITRFNKFKSIQLFNNSYLEYKLKGEHKYHINKMVNMNDSLIIFDNDSSIKLSNIKAIKLRNANHLFPLFSKFFYIGGVMFVGLDSFNNFINHQTPTINQTAVIVSVGLLAAGFVAKQMSIKRIRISNHKSLRVITTDYQNLNK